MVDRRGGATNRLLARLPLGSLDRYLPASRPALLADLDDVADVEHRLKFGSTALGGEGQVVTTTRGSLR